MTGSEPDFEEAARLQKRRGELETRRDVWLTAAVMTCLMPPGTLFGIIALLCARGTKEALATNDLDRADGKLALCRICTAIGTTLGVALLLYEITTVAGAMGAVATLLGHATSEPGR